jgi:hypothetical protein
MAYPLTAWRLDHCWLCPLGGVERALGKVRFAQLIHSGARVLGGPTVRAACGGDLSLTCLQISVLRGACQALFLQVVIERCTSY